MNHIGRSFAIAFIFFLALAAMLVTPQGRQFTAALSDMMRGVTASVLGK